MPGESAPKGSLDRLGSVIVPRPMPPETARLIFIATICLVAGGAAGAYATRTIYGSVESVAVPSAVRAPECPPPPPPPLCPPPPDCGELGVVPRGDAPSGAVLEDPVEPPAPAKPGLPASAIRLGTQAVEQAVAACRGEGDADGALVLDLTLTATGGVAFISDAQIVRRSGQVESVEACVRDRAREARFAYGAAEGEARFKVPVRFGR